MNNAGQTVLSVGQQSGLCVDQEGATEGPRGLGARHCCAGENWPWDSHGLLVPVGMPGTTGPGGRDRGCGDGALGLPPAARLSPAPPPQPGAAAFPPPAVAVATGGCCRGGRQQNGAPGLEGPGPEGRGLARRGGRRGGPRGARPLWGRAVPPSGLADRAGPGRWAEAGGREGAPGVPLGGGKGCRCGQGLGAVRGVWGAARRARSLGNQEVVVLLINAPVVG